MTIYIEDPSWWAKGSILESSTKAVSILLFNLLQETSENSLKFFASAHGLMKSKGGFVTMIIELLFGFNLALVHTSSPSNVVRKSMHLMEKFPLFFVLFIPFLDL